MRGDVAFLYEVNRDAIGFVEAGSRIRRSPYARPYYMPIIFNVNHPMLRQARGRDKPSTRRSIEAQIVRTALNGRGQPADGPVWPNHWAYNSGSRSVYLQP